MIKFTQFIKRALFIIPSALLPFIPDDSSAKEEKGKEDPNIVFLLADDWSYPHAGAYGNKVIETPTFDELAENGVLFHNAYASAPSSSPSRAAMLTGRAPHQLEEAANLWGLMKDKFPVYPQMLENNGYYTGHTGKGWGPGNFKDGGFAHNPAGEKFSSFEEFYNAIPGDKSFCFWFGSNDPHRPYDQEAAEEAGINVDNITVPDFLPDVTTTKKDIANYYAEVQQFDTDCGNIIEKLREANELSNTLIVMTSDNGMPFPGAKATVYDAGTRVPLVVYWKNKIDKSFESQQFVNLYDLAPSFLQAADIDPPEDMIGKSILPLLDPENDVDRNHVFLERERHALVRRDNSGYPQRAIRTEKYLYIDNYDHRLWPAGAPFQYYSVGRYGDVDNSPTKRYILANKNKPGNMVYYSRCFGKRPSEELYNIKKDPYQLNNLADKDDYQVTMRALRQKLYNWMWTTGDPRAKNPNTNIFRQYPYYGISSESLKGPQNDE